MRQKAEQMAQLLEVGDKEKEGEEDLEGSHRHDHHGLTDEPLPSEPDAPPVVAAAAKNKPIELDILSKDNENGALEAPAGAENGVGVGAGGEEKVKNDLVEKLRLETEKEAAAAAATVAEPTIPKSTATDIIPKDHQNGALEAPAAGTIGEEKVTNSMAEKLRLETEKEASAVAAAAAAVTEPSIPRQPDNVHALSAGGDAAGAAAAVVTPMATLPAGGGGGDSDVIHGLPHINDVLESHDPAMVPEFKVQGNPSVPLGQAAKHVNILDLTHHIGVHPDHGHMDLKSFMELENNTQARHPMMQLRDHSMLDTIPKDFKGIVTLREPGPNPGAPNIIPGGLVSPLPPAAAAASSSSTSPPAEEEHPPIHPMVGMENHNQLPNSFQALGDRNSAKKPSAATTSSSSSSSSSFVKTTSATSAQDKLTSSASASSSIVTDKVVYLKQDSELMQLFTKHFQGIAYVGDKKYRLDGKSIELLSDDASASSSSSSSSSAAARHNDQQVKAQKLLKSLLPPGVNTKNMSPVQIQAMLNRYNNMSSILHVAHEDELKNHANSGFKGTAILNGERYDLNGTHYELHPNFANPDRNQRPKPIFIPSEPNTGVDAGIQPPINADFRKGANKGGSIVDSRGIKHEPGGTITTGNNKSQNINSSTSTKKRPTGYDLPSSITSSIHNKNNKIGAMATPNSKSDAHLKPDVDAQAVGPQPPAAVDGVAKAAGTAAVGTAEKRNFCEGHEDPFASQPVDTFVTPKEATFEEAMEWKNALKKMVNKISKMKIGGETLREAIREEVTALQIMRFKMFCKYA
eukprot:CAMPEP_0175003208 /NCGR_PEP_ID=MMETSP0005-20121125/4102_1 /TAXON_ID=420556 /ORGANISM="Ochromonas sp., Strain CCMP1393" /LENGTH=801 /DNA_ID=CAMNT_0016258261 /DNA_START=349 /DNA_END=2754 /DNA_ORIENTATION=-